MTKDEAIAKLKVEYPILKKGNDQDGYEDLSAKEYEETINLWADNLITMNEFTAQEAAKIEAKAQLLAKLGISQDEAKLLLS